VSDPAAIPEAQDAAGPGRTGGVERCATTGITKPECHCRACIAALVASHHRPAAARADAA
jgi:hypothetical protein